MLCEENYRFIKDYSRYYGNTVEISNIIQENSLLYSTIVYIVDGRQVSTTISSLNTKNTHTTLLWSG
jgi:hypothetical protein